MEIITDMNDPTVNAAPNGKPSNLSPEDWAYVRTEEFKAWAGDWEKKARIEKLRRSKVLDVAGDRYIGRYALDNKSAEKYIRLNLRGVYENKDTGTMIRLARRGADKVTRHDAENPAHLISVAYIPEMLENAIFITEEKNEKDKTIYESYRYYVLGMRIADQDYTAKIVVGVINGQSYYDHALTKIEKGNLINAIDEIKRPCGKEEVLSDIKNKRLIAILQTNSSVILDENGEPKLLYHGSTKAFDRFDLSKGGANTGGGWYKDHRTGDAIPIDSERCIFFTDSFHQAASYAFLGHYIDMSHIARDLTAAIAGIRSAELPIGFGFKTKEDFVATIRRIEPLVPSLKKLTFPISSIPKEQREAIVSPLLPLRDQYRAAAQQMERGGLSNQHYNSYRQAAAVESICRNFDRLRKNDLDVRNEFGTFRDYSASICGHSGNAEIYIFADDAGRLVYRGPAGREYFDAMTDERVEEVKQEMRDVSEGCQRLFEETVEQSGYDAAAYIYKVFLKAESPLAHDYAGSAFPDKYKPNEKYGTGYVAARQVAKAIREGNDMVVYEHIRDPFEATSYGVFSPDQILIRQRQHGILPHLQGRDIVRLKKIGATDDEVLALERTKTAVIQAPFAYLGVSPSEASPRLENTPMTLEWRNNGIFVKTAAGAAEPLGAVCHQMAQDRGYLSRTLRPSAPAKAREPRMEQERTTALRR